MSAKYTIKKIISLIKSELNNYYPLPEINSFIHLIFKHYFNYSQTQIHLKQEEIINDYLATQLLSDIKALKKYKPIQYILGHTEFYNLPIRITPGVLIPRPETEELVDWIIAENKNHFYKIADIGTGSGCIAISLAKNLNSSVYALDNSTDALSIARQNSKLNNVELHISLFDIFNSQHPPEEAFDIIVSNPPYVTEKEKRLMEPNVLNYEPEEALFVPDHDPLLYYRAITDFALNHLNRGGKLYFEINENYGEETAILLEEKNFRNIELKKDINGKNRMIRGIFK